jgi:hypothetical protein
LEDYIGLGEISKRKILSQKRTCSQNSFDA